MTVFDQDEELAGVEVGSYSDFATFRDTVAAELEAGKPGSRFPVLMLHSDCEGAWSPEDARALQVELGAIADAFGRLPARSFGSGTWQDEVARQLGLRPCSLRESFIDVDGEPLIDRMLELVEAGIRSGREILFQ